MTVSSLVLALVVSAAPPPDPRAPAPAGAADGGAVPVWTEADALAAFEAGSPALADARAATAAARADVEQAALRPNPQLSLGAGNIPFTTTPPPAGNGPGLDKNLVATAELDQPFELGGKRGKRVAAARASASGAAASESDARRTARFELRRAFWAAVRARARRELAEAVKARYAETIRITRSRYESQDISGVDLDKVELEGLRQQNDLADAVAGERAATAELLTLVGPVAPPAVEARGELATKPLEVDLGALVARARAARPDLVAAGRAVEAARAATASAEAQRVPDLTVGVGYTRSHAIGSGDNPDVLAVTLSLPLPIFARNQGEISKARIEAGRAEHARAALEARIAQEVRAAAARYRAAVEKVGRYDGGALERADRALAVAEKTWRAGDRSLLELLEAERTWIALRGDYLDTELELREAALELERAVGAPLAPEAS